MIIRPQKHVRETSIINQPGLALVIDQSQIAFAILIDAVSYELDDIRLSFKQRIRDVLTCWTKTRNKNFSFQERSIWKLR